MAQQRVVSVMFVRKDGVEGRGGGGEGRVQQTALKRSMTPVLFSVRRTPSLRWHRSGWSSGGRVSAGVVPAAAILVMGRCVWM